MTTHQRSWRNRREGGRGDKEPVSYYGLPVIKRAPWKWLIVWYFFLGGVAGASAALASIAELFGGRAAAPIKRFGRYVSFITLIPSPVLLILDLGRPDRFFHMLRILKLRSPMSVGTWGLTFFGLFNGLATVGEACADGVIGRIPIVRRLGPLWSMLAWGPIRSFAGFMAAAFGFFVAGYTGVLAAATAVPLWAKNKFLLGPLFLTSAMSTGVAAISLALSVAGGASREALHRLEKLERLVLLAELALTVALHRNSGPVIGRPLREGRTGATARWGMLGAGLGLPLAAQALTMIFKLGPSRLRSALSAISVLAGGFCLRYVMVFGGRASADDPEATFTYARR